MYIDTHVHIDIGKEKTKRYAGLTLEKYIDKMDKCGVQKAFVFINPFVEDLLCPKEAKHRVVVNDTPDGVSIDCLECLENIYTGIDPARKYNEELIKESKKFNDRIFPFVHLTIGKNSVPNEVAYFETKYSKDFFGYKLHPTINGRSINDLGKLKSRKALIIHTGVGEVETPENVIRFKEHYEAPIIMAHFARFHEDVIESVKCYDNLYVDSSPTVFLYDLIRNKPHRVYNAHEYFDLESPSSIFEKMISKIGSERILFGSDEPFGLLEEELNEICIANISQNDKDNIVRYNSQKLIESLLIKY